MARRTLAHSGVQHQGRKEGEHVNDNEQPDWSFWCFVIALLELLLQVTAKR